MKTRLRVLLVDDHVLFRGGIAALLNARPGLQVVGEASDGIQAVDLARVTNPDIILMDIHMPVCSGLEAVKIIKREMPHIQIIMLTVSNSDQDLFAAIKCGADGYLLKDVTPVQLMDTLEGVCRGETPISGSLARKILKEFREISEHARRPSEAPDGLSPREREVLEMIVKGLTNKEIAGALTLAEDTVRAHLRKILEKLHVQNRVQAAVLAVREGLVHDPHERNSPVE